MKTMAITKNKFKKIKKEWCISFLIIVLFTLAAGAVWYLASSHFFEKDVMGKASEALLNQEDKFKFLVVADIPGSLKNINPPPHAAAAIASMQVLQAPPAELIVFNGNMISGLDESQYRESANLQNYEGIINNKWQAFYEQIFQPLSIPTKGIIQIPVPGSLDTVLTEPKLLSEAYAKFWNSHKPSLSIKGNYPWWYSFNYKNSYFIILDTSNFAITEEQVSWLEADLESAKSENIFVFSHVPPEVFCSDGGCASLQGMQKQSLFQIMKKYNVKILFTGNNHVYYKARYQGVNVVASGAIGGTFNLIAAEPEKYKQNPSYTVVDVQGIDIRVGAITGNNGPTFSNGYTESLLPSAIPGYDAYTELTKNPISIIPTVISSSAAPLKATGSSGNPQMDQWNGLILDACKQEQNQKECFALVKAFMYVESGGNPLRVSSTGCKGLLQFCLSTAKGKKFSEFFDEKTLDQENDDRFNPEKSIRAGKKYIVDILKKQMHMDNLFIMYVSYNVGPSYGQKARDYFQGKDPTQSEVEAWLEQTDLTKQKINEPKTAFPKLITKYGEYMGQGISSVSYPDAAVPRYGASNLERINAPSAISYYITPSFTLEHPSSGQDDVSVYGKLREYVRWYIKNTESCSNSGKPLNQCSDDALQSLNKEPYFAKNIGGISDCTQQESDLEKFFYDLVEEIRGCITFQQEKMCAIALKAPPQKADEKYSVVFKQHEGKIIIELPLNNKLLTQFTHGLQETIDKKAIMLTDVPNLEGSKTMLNELYITFEQVNNNLIPFIYYKKQGTEDVQGVATSMLYLMPDREQSIIILDPVIGNTQTIDTKILDAAETTKQNTKKLCITSLNEQPVQYLEAVNPLQVRPITYELAVRFNPALSTTKNFFDPMPTFLDTTPSKLSLEQLQLALKDKKIAILSDIQGLKAQESDGFITQLKKSLPTVSITAYAKDARAQWLKDNYFQQEIITQNYDVLILALGSSDVCDNIEFSNLVNSINIMAKQFKTAQETNKVFVVGLPGSDDKTCNNNILIYNGAVSKNDQNNKVIIKQLQEQLGKELSLENIDVGLDIYPDANIVTAEGKYKYHYGTLEKRKELLITHPAEGQLQTIITQKILEGLRGFEPETNNLACKSVFAVGTSSIYFAKNKGGFIDRLKEQFPQIKFESKGYPNEDSGFVAEKFEAEILPSIKEEVDCLIVGAGLNDIGNLASVKKNLQYIYALARKNNMKVIAIELQPYFQKAQNPKAYENTRALNAWFAAEADVEAVVKIYDLTNDPEHEGRMQPKFISTANGEPDFIHYNYEEGHKLVAEEIAKTVLGAD
ncbi:transglycosylase SLT domain-containing protein [Candidatus Woesearchaeota archaeon]|nr:transglycosylase SLT domain-containing protein [Candidatus Woesearchaeota archaeon]